MGKGKTVFVIGAGASQEVGLPVGSELKDKIANALTPTRDHTFSAINCREIYEAIVNVCSLYKLSFDLLLNACNDISKAMPLSDSIDSYINTHKDNKEIEICAKLGIVYEILTAEKNSKLYIDRSNIYNTINNNDINKTWFREFLSSISSCRADPNEVREKLQSFAFIIFNYDRCFEHFLYNALSTYFKFTTDVCGQIVNAMDIYHPYGKVGNLPWQDQKNSIGFGQVPYAMNLYQFADLIKTFSEGTDPSSSEILKIKNHIFEATKIIFLGFSYLDINLELICPLKKTNKSINNIYYYGSAFGISEPNIIEINKKLSEMNKVPRDRILLRSDLKCYKLLSEYEKSISNA